MSPLSTIVAALDFSPGAEAALVRAATLAARCRATLHLVHGVATPHGSPAPLSPETITSLRGRLERFVASALGIPAPGTSPLVSLASRFAIESGPSVSEAILRYVSSLRADLLIVGTHGRRGLDRLLVGSIAEACVARAPCPVLTVPMGAESHEPSPTAPVLVAVDFTARSRDALRVATALADLHGADVELVHVVRDQGPYAGLAPSALSLRDFDAERHAAIQRRLAQFAEDVAPAAFHVALGAPSRQIAAVAEARNAGAVVMGTHGRTGVAHAILGSTAGATLQRASCAVLTIRGAEPSPPTQRRAARRLARAA